MMKSSYLADSTHCSISREGKKEMSYFGPMNMILSQSQEKNRQITPIGKANAIQFPKFTP